VSEKLEQAGSVVGGPGAIFGKMRATTTIKARVFGPDGALIADLGTIVGKRTAAEAKRTNELRKMLADDLERSRDGRR